MAPLAELDITRPDNPAGMTLVGLSTLAFLLWLRARTRRRLVDEADLQPSTYLNLSLSKPECGFVIWTSALIAAVIQVQKPSTGFER